MGTQRKEMGVTMLELLVVIAIIGVMTSVAVGVARSLGPEMRLDSAARDIRSAFQKAKLAAVKKNADCLVVFDTTSPGSYQACIDADASDSCDTGEEVIAEKDFSDYPNISLTGASFTSGDYIQFNSRGSTGSIMGWSAGSVNCTNARGEMKTITVTRTGEININ